MNIVAVSLYSGTIGDYAWNIDSHGVLKISGEGSGELTCEGEAPFAAYASEIISVDFEADITSVKNELFACLTNPTIIPLSETLDVSSWIFVDGREITFVVYPTCAAATSVRNLMKTSDADIKIEYDSSLSREGAEGKYTWCFDTESGKLTFNATTNTWISINYTSESAFKTWKAIWRDAVISIDFVGFSYDALYNNSTADECIFANMPNLESVHMNGITEIKEQATGGFFAGCTSLTTVSFNSTLTSGVVSLKVWTHLTGGNLNNMFDGCSSIKKVVLQTSALKTSAATVPYIFSSMFRGCSSLETIDIPSYVTEIRANAFADCTALKYVNISGDKLTSVSENAFPDIEGLVIELQSYLLVPLFDGAAFTKTLIKYSFAGIVSMDGFSVRLTGYNGLRGLFSADMADLVKYENEGYELYEFGTLVSSAVNRDKCTLTENDGVYSTGAGVVKATVWNNEKGIIGKYLSSTEEKLEYAVTIINFAEANYMSDVYFCSYEIWKTPEGEQVVFYRDCDGTEYDEISLARMCKIMYDNGVVTEENDTKGMVKALVDHYEANRTKNVLFVGDSLETISEEFSNVAKATNKDVVVTAVTNENCSLAKFADPSDACGKALADAFGNNEYDIVVIREQNSVILSDEEGFYASVRDIKEMARQNGAKIYFLASGDADNGTELKLRAAYEYIGSELYAPVCNFGAALTQAKGTSYEDTLAAMTVISEIYGVDYAKVDIELEGVSAEDLAILKNAASYALCGDVSVPEEYKTASEKPLDGKRIIFIGNSHIYYGNTVLCKYATDTLTQQGRMNDEGYFYQLCKANSEDVNVTNWTIGNHLFDDFFSGSCDAGRGCDGVDHASYLIDPYYDYVVACYGTKGNTSYIKWLDIMIDFFREANPNVKIYLMAQASTHGVDRRQQGPDTAFLQSLKTVGEKGAEVIDWGKLIADVVNGVVSVPNSNIEYTKDTFVVSDGYHPNQLTGYITTLMTYSILTGKSAVDQPYCFCGDDSYSTNYQYRTFEEYIAEYYTSTTTNYDKVFASKTDMKGIQTLIDQYIKAKHYLEY